MAPAISKSTRLLIAAGGTGGHVFPGLAVADYVKQQGIDVEWLGTEKGLEQRLVSGRYPLHTLSMTAFRGRGPLQKLTGVVGLVRAFFQARKILSERQAAVVLVMGGYVSAPAGLAAKSLGIPLVIHEQNAVAGMANRWLARLAKRIFEGFPHAFSASQKVIHSGNPLRESFCQTPLRESHSELRILVIGGSQGAKAVNEVVADAIERLSDQPIQWWHQTGFSDYPYYQNRYSKSAQVRCDAFIDDPAAAMAWADVIIARAGALSVCEIAARGRAALFIPYPSAVDDHQYHNAKYLADSSAALILRQSDVSVDKLAMLIQSWLKEPSLLITMGQKARSMAMLQATRLVAETCIKLGHFTGDFQFLKNKAIRSIHCIGLGGIGVSGLAVILSRAGYRVTGVDSHSSATLDYLQSIGVESVVDSVAEVASTDCVIYSRAISPLQPDMQAAKERGIPLYARGEFLAHVVEGCRTLVVAGSHGKSTTSGWAAFTLQQAGMKVNAYLGAVIRGMETSVSFQNAQAPWVMESDESDASCFLLSPTCLVITNIDADHLETYGGSLAILQDRMIEWVNTMDESSVVVACQDDLGIQAILPHLNRRVITYGVSEASHYQLLDCRQEGLHSQLRWRLPGGAEREGHVQLPGKHNALNALAAWIACHEFSEQGSQALTDAWSKYPGVKRRMSIHGTMRTKEGATALVIEDYGHHPREIQATLDAIKSAWPDKRVVMLFQPHRYTRTRDLFHEFVAVLKNVDSLCLLPIYAAGEEDDCGMSVDRLAAAVADQGQAPLLYASLDDAQLRLQEVLKENDILLLQGAGSVGLLALKFCDLSS
jgi:UDP-N-acetylmuramate--alanine ligase